MAFGISENRIGKAERFDRRAYLIDLPLGMGARIARIGNEIVHRPVGDDQARRLDRRYFVHLGTPEKMTDAGSRRFSIKEMQRSSVQGSARRSCQGESRQSEASRHGGSD